MSGSDRPKALWRGYLPLTLYHGVFVLFLIGIGPLLLWRIVFDHRYRIGVRARLGRVPPTDASSTRPVVWIHGVSVGETKAAATLIEAIEQHHANTEIVVSATTPTGFDIAGRLYPGHRVIHFPIDFGRCPGRALDRIRPSCVLLMELEIWPNFLQAAERRHVPVAVINGRISERSFRGYRLVRPLLPQIDWIAWFCVQNEIYRQRLIELGIPSSKITITGNMKYDSVLPRHASTDSSRLRTWLSPDGRQVLVCGSTHGREDSWLAGVAQRIRARSARPLRLVLVPRHPERVKSVIDAIVELDTPCVRWSARASLSEPLDDDDVVIVDTIGQLESFYGVCDVAFVGGSLVPHGGQNMLEPAAMGRAVLFGPHTANFQGDVELLLAAGAAVQVDGVAALERALEELLADAERRKELGARAVALIRANQGATERTRRVLAPMLDGVPGDPRPVAQARS